MRSGPVGSEVYHPFEILFRSAWFSPSIRRHQYCEKLHNFLTHVDRLLHVRAIALALLHKRDLGVLGIGFFPTSPADTASLDEKRRHLSIPSMRCRATRLARNRILVRSLARKCRAVLNLDPCLGNHYVRRRSVTIWES